jgi:hypothetical protein
LEDFLCASGRESSVPGRAFNPPGDRTVIFDERSEGDYRIYAGALEAPRGQGWIAAVVVNRVRGIGNAPREAYRDDSVACGHRWLSPDEALSYALNRAREVIRREQQRLRC